VEHKTLHHMAMKVFQKF